jgi:hypothetical protein
MRRSRLRLAAVAGAIASVLALTCTSAAPAIPPDDYDPMGDQQEMPLHHAPMGWRQSPILWQWAPHWLSGNPSKLIGAWAAFEPTDPGGNSVRPGDVFLARVSAGVGETRAGGALIRMGLMIPNGLQFATDPNHPVRCLLYGVNDPYERATNVTSRASAACPHVPTNNAVDNLGQRVVPNMHQFVVELPLRATADVSQRRITGAVESDQIVDPPGTLLPDVWFGTPPQPAPFQWSWYVRCVWDNPNNPGPC